MGFIQIFTIYFRVSLVSSPLSIVITSINSSCRAQSSVLSQHLLAHITCCSCNLVIFFDFIFWLFNDFILDLFCLVLYLGRVFHLDHLGPCITHTHTTWLCIIFGAHHEGVHLPTTLLCFHLVTYTTHKPIFNHKVPMIQSFTMAVLTFWPWSPSSCNPFSYQYLRWASLNVDFCISSTATPISIYGPLSTAMINFLSTAPTLTSTPVLTSTYNPCLKSPSCVTASISGRIPADPCVVMSLSLETTYTFESRHLYTNWTGD